jgi:hypothetical protein
MFRNTQIIDVLDVLIASKGSEMVAVSVNTDAVDVIITESENGCCFGLDWSGADPGGVVNERGRR